MFHEIFLAITQATVTALLTLRVYALYGCRRIILVVFLGIILLGTAMSIILTIIGIKSSTSTSSTEGCHVLSSSQSPAHTAIAWEGILVLDTALFGMTLWKGFRARLHSDATRLGVSLLSVVVRDGTIYFLITTTLNVANIISFNVPGRFQGNLSTFVGCLSVVLMSRMMLDLHEATDTGIYDHPDEVTPGRAYTH
ncbi:hypothetical protein BT96DRAFT_343766 [Gymnopus androsaceus JB14]|uniref:Uncharacterized protein n=1 Tax=Gymnopus androsaceus JB14 TaxID=1447944 RepID=A0A6A4GX43_9AGAR|nr:hypothetical protein BT96DRAFT_343766 [Gymnopus androsaceus JB14]